MKSHLQYILIIIFIFFSSGSLFSQYYVIGQDPASIKWKQLNSPYFRIIYPDGYQKKAQEYANLLELSRNEVSSPYLENNKKFQIVLHNRSVTSNAMVNPTPMHGDFFEMPDQNTYAQTWAKQLTLHEYRHVAQMQKLNQGLTKGLSYAFGEQAVAGILGVFLPFWFIEGDAVYSETIYSSSGRGRSPDFSMDLKAQVLDKKIYSYDKALYGSYKNYTPDHYTLGYELITYGNIHFGNNLWNSTLNKVARRPYTLVPFTCSLKEKTGTGKVKFYKKALLTSKNIWISEDSTKQDPVMITPEKNKHFTNYRFINPISDGSFIVEKIGIDDINRIVKVFPDGSEKRLTTPGYDFRESLSANDSLICWNEKTYDPRWSNRDYSVIKIYNYNSKKLAQISKKSRLFAPALANKSSKIVAVKVSEENNYSLVVIDIVSGNITNEFTTDNNLFFTHPRWSNDDKYIVSVVVGNNGKSIIKINATSWEYELILPEGYTNISRPVMKDNHIIYSGAYEGTSDIYLYNLKNGRSHKLTNVRFGATDPVFSIDNNEIHIACYTSDGYRISSIPFVYDHTNEVKLNNLKASYLIDELVTDDQFNLDEIEVPQVEYQEKKYSRTGHLFNLHSWGLAAVDLNNYDFQPGVNILTQNILSTAYGTIGYYYDPNENAGKTKVDFTYAGWYPTINISGDYGLRRVNYIDTNMMTQEVKWMETNISFGLSLPLNLTRNAWVTGIQPSITGDQKFLNIITDQTLKEDQVTSLSYGLYGYIQRKRSLRDIFPKIGLSTNLFLRHTPFSSSASMISGLTGTVFLPGIINHHGIRIYAAYQYTKEGNYNYSNMISTPRGYTGIRLNNMMSLKSEYALPIIYPDLNFPAIAYLKRITAHVFYDYVIGDSFSNLKSENYSSTGLELYTDWNFLSLIPNIRLGVRSAYRFHDDQVNFEFLYGFSIN